MGTVQRKAEEKKALGAGREGQTNSILAGGKSRMLPNDPLFKLHSVVI